MKENSRLNKLKTASLIAFILNTILCSIKIVVGILFTSLPLIVDGIQNLSDIAFVFFAFIGFKIAGKPADNEHPFGHERFENIISLILATVLVCVGVEIISTSIETIINPKFSPINNLIFYVLTFSIAIKTFMAFYYFYLNKKYNSLTFKATFLDSITDIATSITIFIGLLLSNIIKIALDGYITLGVAIIIIINSVKIIIESSHVLIGCKLSKEKHVEIINKIKSYPKIENAYNLKVHSYGSALYATVNVVFNSSANLNTIEKTTKQIVEDFKKDSIDLVIQPEKHKKA